MLHRPVDPGWTTSLPSAFLICLFASAWVIPVSVEAAPEISDVSHRGLQIGGTTIVTIRGQDLLADSRLLLPVPVIRQEIRPGATAEMIEMEVEIAADVVPGIIPLRIHNRAGISNSVAVGIDRLPERQFASEIATLPVALHGTLRGTEIRTTSFQGRRGMRVTVDVEARRLGSSLRPVVRVLDEQGRQMEWNQGIDYLQGDARCTLVLPSDGKYQVQLHDLLYRAADLAYFRLKIGSFDFADQVFPTGIQRGESATLQLLSAGKGPTSIRVSPAGDEPLSWLPAVSRSPWFSGIPPRVAVSDHPELIESSNESPTLLTSIPIAVSGRLASPGEADHYLVDVQPGTSLRLEMFAQRLGSSLDLVLLVQDEQGNPLARGDDQSATTDPGLDFTVPADVNRLRLVVQDLIGRGGEQSIYRLVVRDLSRPHFSLALDEDRLNVASMSGSMMRVSAERHAYSGPIELHVLDLPEGVRVTGAKIPPGATAALVAFHAPRPGDDVTQARLTGLGMADDISLVSVAEAPVRAESRMQPWYRNSLPAAATWPGPLRIVWGDEQARLPRGGRLLGNVQVERSDGVTGKVRVRLLTTQPMPRKKIKENNEEKEVDDIERALRLAEEITLEPSDSEAWAAVEVPLDLPDVEWAMAFVAELLAEDGETVVSSAFTETRFHRPETPLTVELSGESPLDLQPGGEEPGILTGTLKRWDRSSFPVTLRLDGLPEGITVPSITVPADESSFRFPISLPESAADMEWKDVTLVASTELTPAGKTFEESGPAVTVRSQPLPVTIRIAKGSDVEDE
jgi:hypothetical protein